MVDATTKSNGLDAVVDEQAVRQLMEQVIQFNAYIGLEVVSLSLEEGVRLRIPFRKEFMGDPVKKIVHGGILSTLVDVTGGATAFASLLPGGFSGVAGVNTVDMRVDYLRPGAGEWFEGVGNVIRKGNRIVVTHINVHNNEGTQIAMGTATYSVQQRKK